MTDLRLSARIAVVYFLLVCAGFLLWTRMPLAASDGEAQHWARMGQGVVYVLATSGLLFWLVLRGARLLCEQESRFRLLVERAPDAVLVQTQGRIAYVNGAALQLLGAASEQALLGRDMIGIIHPDSRAAVRQRIAQTTEARASLVSEEETFLRLDGTPVICEVSTVPVRYNGQDGEVVFIHDATRRTQVLKQRLYEQKMETIRQLAGGLAHDINNLLQVINGYTELACEALTEDAQGRSYLEQVRVSGKRASALVGQLMSFSNNQTLGVEALDLHAMSAGTMRVLHQVSGSERLQASGVREPQTEVAGERAASEEKRKVPGGRSVLIAEDDEMVRRLTAKILKKAGYTVLEAEDGLEAVELFEQHAEELAVVVLDVVMPRMGGFEAYDRIRALNDRMPILFASGFSGYAPPAHVTLTPGVNLLQKPFDSHLLLSAVRRTAGF